jgi:hypothetical protein
MKATEKLTSEEINLLADTLSDLSLSEEQAEETKAGATAKLFLHCATGQHI